ncbi:MAG: class I mannose-6-phosphate isomerase [Oscillospiraceae bacterium]|nr:class I mannose-6-phosphate isomerase [Oscillospiraceae bacterium]
MKAFKLIPPIKDYIWGGTKLRDEYGKQSNLERLAESWELACHKDGMSIISGGEYDGKTLYQYITENPQSLGKNAEKFKNFPILIKLIDARENLSVQVHPDNAYALKNEGEYGKTEMWYIIDCEPDSTLIYGFKDKISKEDFRKAIENNILLDKLNIIPVKKGDVFFIKAGTLHAIGKGILIAEIQQNSNTTYRVYDYDRKDIDGNKRELHIDKAIDVADLKPSIIKKRNPDDKLLARCKYFRTYKEDIETSNRWHQNRNSFTHVLIIDGEGKFLSNYGHITYNMNFIKGESIFVPAGVCWCISGKCSIIYTVI